MQTSYLCDQGVRFHFFVMGFEICMSHKQDYPALHVEGDRDSYVNGIKGLGRLHCLKKTSWRSKSSDRNSTTKSLGGGDKIERLEMESHGKLTIYTMEMTRNLYKTKHTVLFILLKSQRVGEFNLCSLTVGPQLRTFLHL